MFDSFYGETLKAYQNRAAGVIGSLAVPDRVWWQSMLEMGNA